MSYIQPHMRESLAAHVLEKESDSHVILRRPGRWDYLLHVAEIGRHIVLTGDLTIGGPHGCVSAGGYGLEWFSSPKSEMYLCEKFLQKEWQWEVAQEQLRSWLAHPEDYNPPAAHRAAIQCMLDGRCYWTHDEPNEFEFHEALYELSPEYYVTESPPGYDYPRADAGWLCAAQQKFAALMQASVQEVPAC